MSEYASMPGSEPIASPIPESAPDAAAQLDLDLIESDLADVEVALARLDSGEYWRDEVTGAPLDDSLLATRPTARRSDTAAR
jgi:RNA polymerase-binding transcription factor DksA